MKEPCSFVLSGEIARADIETLLAEGYTLAVDDPVAASWRFYDTFDWRLFNRSLVLRASGEEFTVAPLAGGKSLHCNAGSRLPTFAWDFAEGACRQKLSPILQERALLALANVGVEETTYRFLNKEQKTVVRLTWSEVQANAGKSGGISTATYVTVQPVRGYAKHARRLVNRVAFGEAIDSLDEAIYLQALQAAGQTPNSYSSKLDVRLDPAMRADEATKVILRRLLETLRANEAGIRADIDTEFLHDYRVAVRRTRSALSQIREVFPAHTTRRFKQDFRALGSCTNELRDLDVYLLAEPDYRAMLPDALRDDIVPLFTLLRNRRAEIFQSVVQRLDEERTERVLADWATFINAPAGEESSTANAGLPIIDLARKRIYKRYRRIIKDGSYILDHTEDELLHALRLECKKLRYLLEFFASLFPRKQSGRLIKELKRLQDNLGRFTDLAVQQEWLLTVAKQLPDNDPRTRRALIATGALVEALARRQETVKAEFAETFAAFAARANQKRYRALFDSKEFPKEQSRRGCP